MSSTCLNVLVPASFLPFLKAFFFAITASSFACSEKFRAAPVLPLIYLCSIPFREARHKNQVTHILAPHKPFPPELLSRATTAARRCPPRRSHADLNGGPTFMSAPPSPVGALSAVADCALPRSAGDPLVLSGVEGRRPLVLAFPRRPAPPGAWSADFFWSAAARRRFALPFGANRAV